jgi:GT2 family glycosyltransferase
MSPDSTAMNPDAKLYARTAGKRAIEKHLERIGMNASVVARDRYPGFNFLERVPLETSKVSVVIPTRGDSGTVLGQNKPFVIRCLESIVERNQKSFDEVIVVADNSEDTSYLELAHELLGSRLTVVDYDLDFNFSDKVNVGISEARNEFILLLNDDVQLISENWLDQMVAILEQPDVGAVGPLLYFEDGTIQHGGHFYAHGGATHKYLGEGLSPGFFGDLILEHEVSGVTAAYMLIRKSTWSELGGFATDLPNNFNDVDYCLRLRSKNLRIVFTPLVEAYHFESKTRDSSVHWSEVARIQQRWGSFLGAEREPFGPGGMPKGFITNEKEAKKIFKKRFLGKFRANSKLNTVTEPVALGSNYQFSLKMVGSQINDEEQAYLKSEFENLHKAFQASHEFDLELPNRVLDIYVTDSVQLSWNFLKEVVTSFEENPVTFLYSDYVDSLDESQSMKRLPSWSPERFLGIDYLGPCFVVDPIAFELDPKDDIQAFTSARNSKLMSAPMQSVGRLPEFVYQRLSSNSHAAQVRHQAWSIEWVADNRPGVTHQITSTGMIQYLYKSYSSGLVSIIIPTRFSVDESDGVTAVEKCLSSFMNQNCGGIEMEVILVCDTDSDAKQRHDVIEKFSQKLNLKVVDFNPPFNFSKKCNIGAEQSTGELLIFLNDDTEWLSSNSILELMGVIKGVPNAGAVGAVLKYPNDLIQHAGMIFRTPAPGHAYIKQADFVSQLGDGIILHEVSGVTGACIAMSRDTLEEIGGWNEDFPSSYNDVDLCAMLRKHGYSIFINPSVSLRHFESLTRNPYATTSEIKKLLSRNSDLLRWDPYFRTSLAEGVDDTGKVLRFTTEPDYSGKYFKYAMYLMKNKGFGPLLGTITRRITGKSKSWKEIEKLKSVY